MTNGEQPFWGYRDLALVLSAAVPSMLTAGAAVFLLDRVLPLGGLGRAAQVLLVQFLSYGALFLVIYAVFRYRYRERFWPALAWNYSPREFLRALAGGPILAVGIALASVALRAPKVETPFEALLDSTISVILVGIAAVTLGPLCEELLFRGFLLPPLARTFGRVGGVVLAAAPFAVLHGPQYAWSWRHVLLIGLAGTVFGWVRLSTRSTAAATALHTTYNLTFFAGYLLTEGSSYRLW